MLQIDSTRTDGQNKSGSFPSLYPQQQLAVPTMTMPKTPVAESASVQLPTPVEIPTATLPAPTTNPYASFLPNTGFRITTSYGSPSASSNPALKGRAHNAIDIGTPMNTPFYSPGYGTVIQNEPQNGTYSIRFSNGNTMVLAHTKERYFNIGDTVRPGDLLGLSGNTGDSTGPHTHLGIIDKKGNKLNPTNFYYGRENPFAVPVGQGATTDKVALGGTEAELDTTQDTYKGTDMWRSLFQSSGIDTTPAGVPKSPLVNLATGLGAGYNLYSSALTPGSMLNTGALGAFNWLTTGKLGGDTSASNKAYGNSLGQLSSNVDRWQQLIDPNYKNQNIFGADWLNIGKTVGGVIGGGLRKFVDKSVTDSAASKAAAEAALDPIKNAMVNAINAGGQPIYEDIYKRTLGKATAINPAGTEFDPINNLLDRALVESGILSSDSGDSVDIDTLRALRGQMDVVLKGETNLSDQAASNANTAINEADKAALAMVGRQPGDIGQSSYGRNAMFSYTKAANKNIAEFNSQVDSAKLQSRATLADKTATRLDTDRQNQFNLNLAKLQAQQEAAVKDGDNKRAADIAMQQVDLTVAEYKSTIESGKITDLYNAQYAISALVAGWEADMTTLQTQIDGATDDVVKQQYQAKYDILKASVDKMTALVELAASRITLGK